MRWGLAPIVPPATLHTVYSLEANKSLKKSYHRSSLHTKLKYAKASTIVAQPVEIVAWLVAAAKEVRGIQKTRWTHMETGADLR